MPIDIINITDIQANETNVNWFADGERANALVLNRPIKEVSAKVNETIGVTNTLQTDVGTLQTDVGVLQTDVNTLEQDFLDYKLDVTTTLVNKTLEDREFCYVGNSGLTITLPLNPSIGSKVGVGVQDYADTIISRNGEPIMRLAENMTIDQPNVTVIFLYVSETEGWRIL